jgi:S-methylmethionine-dependent homocysteine/selenocysteine methylase
MVSFYEDGEVDLVLLEMMSVPSRMLPLFECVSSSRLPVWCGLSAERSDRNATITGYGDQTIPLIDNIQEAVNFGFEGMGIMHSSVDLIGDAIELVKTKHDGLIMAYPDSGYFKSPNWQFEEIITPDHLVQFATQWKQAGTNIIGGCCGLGPEHTEALCNLK